MNTNHESLLLRIVTWKLRLSLLLATSLYGQFHQLETKNVRLIYLGKSQAYLAPHVARCFENALQFHRSLFDYSAGERATVLMDDFSDYGNGGASTVPFNLIRVGMSPFSYVYETMPANERMNWMMNHELAHVVIMDKGIGADNFYRTLFFGKVLPTAQHPESMLYSYLTNPRRYTPRWYLEGSAVFLETWMAGGLGRALGAYDEMVFRTMVRDGAYIYDLVGLESEGTTVDFQVGVNAYLYGTRFMSYLAYQYTPEKLLEWLSRKPGSKAYFAGHFKKTFGRSIDDGWRDWIEWERGWQNANLDSIRLQPTTPYRPMIREALGSVSRAFYDSTSHQIYVAVLYPGKTAHIAAIEIASGQLQKICDVPGPALYSVSALAFDAASRILFFTTDHGNWRDLRTVDLRSGKTKMLMKDSRVGDLAFNAADQSLWGVRHDNGLSTLVRIRHPYKEWNQIYTFPYGRDFYDIDVSPDGAHLTGALVEVSGQQRLIKFAIEKLLAGDASFEVLFDFENSNPANFIFSTDGRYLYGSSYYSGVSNIYRYDFEKNDMEILSNCETGFFRPLPVSADSLVVMNYSGKGFVPVLIANQPLQTVSAVKFLGNEIANKYPIVRGWVLPSPAAVNLDSVGAANGNYNLLSNIRLASAYPVVEGYKDFAAVGVHLDFSDRIGLSGLGATVSYTPDGDLPASERLHVTSSFRHWQWELHASYNGADFYDLFGPTKTSRKGYSLGIKYKKSLLFEPPKTVSLNFSVTGYGGLERLPDFQNVAATFEELLSARASLNFQNVRKTLGAVDDEKGVKWQLAARNNYVNKRAFPGIYTTLDYGILLPIKHSSLWLRSSAGQAFGDRENPFANFFFGGFGNNWVDHLDEKRYREYYSFPGVELNEIGGKNFAKTMLEWNLPPLRFRRVGFPAFYLNWARLAVFSTAIRTNLDDAATRRTSVNLGAQLDFRLVLFSHQAATFSVGFAAAKNRARRDSHEWMISLKLL
jgi:hypothetical protein